MRTHIRALDGCSIYRFVVCAGLRNSLAHETLSAFLSRHAGALATIGGAVLLAGESYYGRTKIKEDLVTEFGGLNTRLDTVQTRLATVQTQVVTGIDMVFTLMQAMIAKDTKPAQEYINAIATIRQHCRETGKDCGPIGFNKMAG